MASAASAAPDTPVPISDTEHYLSLSEHVQWLVVPHGEEISAEEALARYRAGEFECCAGEWLELGMMSATVWVVATIRNDLPDDELVLEVRNPRASYVDFYFPDDAGNFEMQQSGSANPFSLRRIEHPMPAFPFRLAPGETRDLMLRIDNVGDFRFRIWLWDAPAFFNRISTAYYTELVTIGVWIALAALNLLVFLSLRESAYLYLSLFVVSWLLFFVAGNGIGNMFIWRDLPWVALRANTLTLILMLITFVLFTMSFLDTHRLNPWLYRLGLASVAVYGAHLVYSSATDTVLRLAINRYLTLYTLALIVVLVAGALRRGSKMAWFFLATWCFVLVGAAMLLLMSWYVLSNNWILGTPIISALFSVSILLWSLELTGRVRIKAQEQRRILEAQVRERTAELQRALSEVKTLSGLLPICSSCKKIRDDKGYWNSVEQYLTVRTDANFTHGVCPDCYTTLYPELADRRSSPRENPPEAPREPRG